MKGKISTSGFRKDSPDRHNDYNIIPSRHISMKDVNHPVRGIDNLGNSKMMFPGATYSFPGHSVLEIPIRSEMKEGGSTRKLKGVEKHTDISLDDKDIDEQNKKYFIQRIDEIGIDGAIKEYLKHFGTNKKRKIFKKK